MPEPASHETACEQLRQRTVRCRTHRPLGTMDFELRTFRRDPVQFGAASFNQDFCRSCPLNNS